MENYDLSEFFSDNLASFVHIYGALNSADLNATFKKFVSASSLLSSDTKKIVSTFSVSRSPFNGKMIFSVPGLGRSLDEHNIRDRWNGSIHGPSIEPPDKFGVLQDFFGNLKQFHTNAFQAACNQAVSDFESNAAVKQARHIASLVSNFATNNWPVPSSQEDMIAIFSRYSIVPDYTTPQESTAWIPRDNTHFNPQFLFISITNHLAAMNGCWSIRLKDASKCKVASVTCNPDCIAANVNSPFAVCEQCTDYLGITNTTTQLSGTGNNWGTRHCPDLSINSSNSYNIYNQEFPKKGAYNNIPSVLNKSSTKNFYINLYPGLPTTNPDACSGNSPTDSCGGTAGSACSPFLFNTQPGTTLKCFNGNFWLAMADMFPGTFYSKPSSTYIYIILFVIAFFFLFFFFLIIKKHRIDGRFW